MTIRDAWTTMRSYFSKPDAEFAMMSNQSCAYLTDDGRKCAIGCLIPDSKYDAGFEGENARKLLHDGLSWMIENEPDAERVEEFLIKAQLAHDGRATGLAYAYSAEALSGFDTDDVREIEVGMSYFLADLDALAKEFGIPVM